jgi:hypothetical protein
MFDKLRKGQVTILGKAIPIFVLVALLAIGTVSALLTVYITITGSATVAQSVVLNGFDSTWKYDANPTWTPTGATWSVSSMVAGDEQDVGFKISNYAELSADIKLVGTITGPTDEDYEKCKDVIVEFWDDYDPATEKCTGTKIAGATECADDTTTTYATIAARPSVSDPSIPTEDWLCARYIFDIKAVPGSYGFTIVINPSSA